METKYKEKALLVGKWKLTAYFKGTKIIAKQLEGRNRIVTIGLGFISNALIDTSAVYDTGLTYCAIGTDNTAPAAGDAALGTESARKSITSRTIVGVESTFSTFMTAAESTFAIKEAGLFGGSNAGAGAGTGLLFSHWLVAFSNILGVYDITLDYVLTPSYS